MKTKFLFFITALSIFSFSCSKKETNQNDNNSSSNITNSTNQETSNKNILITYFSCTNTTKKIAEMIQNKTKGDMFQIEPVVPYSEEDRKYYTNSRCDKEQNDPSCRPEISNKVENISKYKYMFLGYPIWHSQAPKIMYTFVESYDLTNITIIPFCSSHSSGIGSSATNLAKSNNKAIWKEGKRFSSSSSQDEVSNWIENMNLD